KIMFDRLSLVAETKNEIRVAVMGIVFHHMPEDGHVADFDQRFRDILRMILEPHSKAAAKQYDFHKIILSASPVYLSGFHAPQRYGDRRVKFHNSNFHFVLLCLKICVAWANFPRYETSRIRIFLPPRRQER